MREPTDAEIERGAEKLREIEMVGRITRDWSMLPKCDKRKWRIKAEAVLRYALALSS
jgi:sensor domain CHASE-containing protein